MYKIKKWSAAEFATSRQAWSELLKISSADPLFMSWEWQYTWWDKFGEANKLNLLLLAAYDENNRLVGIAPLFTSTITSKKYLKLKRIEFIGNCWRGAVTMRTEKIDFIIRQDIHDKVLQSLLGYLNTECEWDEFIISDLSKQSKTFERVINSNMTCRIAESYSSYYLDLPDNFSDYLNNLGKNTRLQIFNRRKKLVTEGEVEVKCFSKDHIDECFEILNYLHKKRWNNTAFQNSRLDFNKTVARLMAEKEALHFVVLYVNNEPESIQYNYCIDKTEYNIQAGFNEDFGNKIPLGYLLFGYAIENAIESGIKTYDFLAGEGKNSQYKSRLTNQKQEVVDIQVINSRWLLLLYRLYDFIRK